MNGLLQLFGLLLFLHDIRDLGKVDRIHHYQIGVVLMYLGGH